MKIPVLVASAVVIAAASFAPSLDAQAPGGSTGRHTHFGVESGFMIQGSASMEVEGETPKLLKAGDSYTIPAGKVHDAKAVGDGPAKVIASYVVEKGKPLATPAGN